MKPTTLKHITMNKTLKALVSIVIIGVIISFMGCSEGKKQSGIIDGHAYVDLGLPSGTLWATCNVGAKSPQKYGGYFAWGETMQKDNYSWSTYSYGFDENKLKKYCGIQSFGYNGFVDNLTELELSDDVATVNWGGGWRIPTRKQWNELLDCCRYDWITYKGVNGMLFWASNGKQLFLPAAGCCCDNDLAKAKGLVGHYMTSSLCETVPKFTWKFFFDEDFGCRKLDGSDGRGTRYFGVSVRPVHNVE